MKTLLRRHKLLFLSVLLGFCAFVSSYSALRGYIKSGPVVVALRDFEPYVELTSGDVRVVEVPEKGVPRGAITTVEGAVGRYTRTRLVTGQVILAGHVVDGQEGAGLSYDLPSDSRGMFLPVPASRALGGLLREGERVDVIVAFKNSAAAYGIPVAPAFTALRDLPIVEVVVDGSSGEFAGVVVLAQSGDCERVAEHLEDANLYLALVPRNAETPEAEVEVWPER